MKRHALLFATLATVALALACSSNSAPETPRITPSASQAAAAATVVPTAAVQPTPTPTATAAIEPTTPPTAGLQPTQPPAVATQPQAPQPTSPPAPSGPVTISVSASNLAFDRTSISVPANTSITVNFTNDDMLVLHDFGVSIPFVPHTETCAGTCAASITFDSGPPGSYTFQCTIHPEMVGSFTVN